MKEKMIIKGTKLKILDNSGIKSGRCIHIYGKKKWGKIGDKILIVVLKVKKGCKFSPGKLVKGTILCTKFIYSNPFPSRFNLNAAVIHGFRIKQPLPYPSLPFFLSSHSTPL